MHLCHAGGDNPAGTEQFCLCDLDVVSVLYSKSTQISGRFICKLGTGVCVDACKLDHKGSEQHSVCANTHARSMAVDCVLPATL